MIAINMNYFEEEKNHFRKKKKKENCGLIHRILAPKIVLINLFTINQEASHLFFGLLLYYMSAMVQVHQIFTNVHADKKKKKKRKRKIEKHQPK